MTDRVRIKIAGGVTALFIGALIAAGLGVRSTPAAAPPVRPAADVQVRSEYRPAGEQLYQLDEEGLHADED